MPTFGDWERTVLEHAYEHVDYISCHAYYQERGGDLGSFLASSLDMQYFIDTVVATADHVGNKLKSKQEDQASRSTSGTSGTSTSTATPTRSTTSGGSRRASSRTSTRSPTRSCSATC